MKEEILNHIHQPAELEKLYRSQKGQFKRVFAEIYPSIQDQPIARFWNERLNFESDGISWGSKTEFILVVSLGLIAGLYAKFPAIFSIDEEFFFPRNLSFLVFPFLAVYFAWKNQIAPKKIIPIAAIIGICLVYINLIPDNQNDITLLIFIHMPLLLWGVLGMAFSGAEINNLDSRLAYLRFNGDAIVMGAVLFLAGAVLSGLTVGLFNLIGINIEEFYAKYILVFGAASIPPFATFLTQTNPQLVNKVSPVIAKIFSPLVLVMLVTYLIAIVYSGKDPYNDREFLLLFNMLLIGVLALIFFSIAESSEEQKISSSWVLTALSAVTIIVNGIALSAIVFRISEWGITPNRLAVLGVNVLMLVHLIMVFRSLWIAINQKKNIYMVGRTIAIYLPIYFLWTVIVVFVFPFVFGFD
ncbi:hypothetical protein ACFOSV_16920 [Algoriphagus namhaensis]|uniref:DUF4153 domain-containing protein n=1 Tax=Algoriphagus namhaensis TaxID=915353 RepID=A0ABV8AYB9_9BACT